MDDSLGQASRSTRIEDRPPFVYTPLDAANNEIRLIMKIVSRDALEILLNKCMARHQDLAKESATRCRMLAP